MDVSIILMILGGVIFYGHYLEKISEKISVPDILGLVFLGVFIGPIMQWVSPDDFGIYGSLLSTLVLALILYSSGLGMDVEKLKGYVNASMGLVYIGNFATWALVSALAYFIFDINALSALYVGGVLSGTSSAVVLVFIKNLNLTDKTKNILTIESVKTDIFNLVFPSAILGVMLTGDLSIGKIGLDIVLLFFISLGIGVVSGIVWAYIINKIPVVKETKFSTICAMLVVYGLTQYLGYNGALMSIAFGITLGNIGVFKRNSIVEKLVPQTQNIVTKKEVDFLSEINFILKVYFFIYVGISIQVDSFNTLAWVSLIILSMFVLRAIIVKYVISKDTPLLDKSMISIMRPNGMATAVMGGLPLAQGYVEGEEIQSILYSGLILSIIITNILFFLLDKKIILPFYKSFYGGK
ncbi:MAG: cation:proton antiporter [Flavobacteriaceae bacterium]|nr:cation:proton antiporter [Flavobacteriaceae bacterium]